MNDFINPDPYVEKTEDIVCRDCGKTFQNTNLYDKNGFAVSFQPKYCKECNLKPKITGNNGSWGTINIEHTKVPQKNVEGLEESLQTLATSIAHSQNATDESIGKLMDDFRAFKKHAEYDIELNTNNIEKIRTLLIALHIMVLGLFVFDLGVVWYIIKH